jgi:hypothetical protein
VDLHHDCVSAATAIADRGLLAYFTGVADAGRRYLDKRGLPTPVVNWDSIRELNHRTPVAAGARNSA